MESFAIITDIHGNSSALEAVLKDINRREIEHIICLGDMVGIGPDSNEVLEMLMAQEKISFVIGNHDLAVISAYEDSEPPIGHHLERAHHKWLADRMDQKYINFMSKLPKQLILEASGFKFYFTHYHLDEAFNYLPVENEPTVEKLERLYAASGFDCVCFGHHHIVHQFKSDRTLYFNPGSLGCNHRPVARYGIIQVSESGIEEQRFEVPYDNREFLRSYEQLKVPDREFILKIFHGSQLTQG